MEKLISALSLEENNNNNESNSEIFDIIWDPKNLGSNLEILGPGTVISHSNYNKNSHVTGTHEFKKNTGIFKWNVKISQLQGRSWVFLGVCRLKDVNFRDEYSHNKFYGYSSNGNKYENTGAHFDLLESNKIPSNNGHYMLLEFNTNTAQLKVDIVDNNGTNIYLSNTLDVEIPFPVYPFCKLSKKDNKVEVVKCEHIYNE
eukprot:TRINITY_DN1378_c0_g6_i3.p1 TRINITY_DN1378_c0_g6~~TRINITY_DN1378_c0_g6_i3.p1  ORF type:complete len:201 (+),score=47.76 TRINITY_DN1378_c0_g6_i3:166-768(+)